MLQLIYATDLHGSIPHYENVFNFAVEHNFKLIHLGADLLPKGSGILKIQKDFINGYLKDFYKRCKNCNIKVLSFFGNDDIYSRKPYFKKFANLLDEKPYDFEGYEFKAYGYVQDYPFGLKTACKLDHDGWTCPDFYTGTPVDIGPTGLKKIEGSIEEYFQKKGTIEDDLKKIPVTNKTIIAIHQPPWSINLDVCQDGRRVGSKAVYDWILKNPCTRLILCGHIHENFKMTGEWKAQINKTLVVQPGQNIDKTIIVLCDISDEDIKLQRIELKK